MHQPGATAARQEFALSAPLTRRLGWVDPSRVCTTAREAFCCRWSINFASRELELIQDPSLYT